MVISDAQCVGSVGDHSRHGAIAKPLPTASVCVSVLLRKKRRSELSDLQRSSIMSDSNKHYVLLGQMAVARFGWTWAQLSRTCGQVVSHSPELASQMIRCPEQLF